MIELGWYEGMIILAVAMLALKFGFDELRKRLRGGAQVRNAQVGSAEVGGERNGPTHSIVENRSSISHSAPTRDTSSKRQRISDDRATSGDELVPSINITNIEIHDSVINRSTILPGDGDEPSPNEKEGEVDTAEEEIPDNSE